MNKLRHSLMRSRTPTGAEMKQQNSLEVPPPQIRSASFDEVQFKADRRDASIVMGSTGGGRGGGDGGSSGVSVIGSQGTSLEVPGSSSSSFLLRVPYLGPKRSKSFDSGCGDEEEGETNKKNGRPVPYERGMHCVHCNYLDMVKKRRASRLALQFSDKSTSREDDDDVDWENSSDDLNAVICGIKVTLSPNSPSSASPTHTEPVPARSSRANSPKLERQPAIYCMPPMTAHLSSQENSLDQSDGGYSHHSSFGCLGSSSEYGDAETSGGTTSGEIFLSVPTKLDRAVSLDMTFSSSYPTSFIDSELLSNSVGVGMTRSVSLEPPQALRSKSIDIELPTDMGGDYKVLVTSPKAAKKAINSEVEIQCDNGEKRVIRSTCDWNETAINGDHLWCPTSASGDFCYVGEDACCKNGARLKCSACKIIAHTHCIPALVENVKFTCKPTFRDVGPRQYREQTATHHHWVHRRNQKGKCKSCNKGFQGKLLFGSKEIVAISCSWCKQAFHNREACFPITKLEETCSLGLHQSIIVPPSWIVKLPRRGSFKSSLRKSPKKRASKKNKTREKDMENTESPEHADDDANEKSNSLAVLTEKDTRTFAIKPIPNADVKPVIVFINPKSGGNQGAKLMQKFQWLLNPRQVFDLTQGGPRAGMEMFRKVSQLRVLACGGDGTVGWVLSILDQMDIEPPPAVAVLPLGTGNDLARALGWGGGYTDEPISKILCNISDGEVIHLDRWKLDVQKNPDAEPSEEGKDTLPLTVVNNYFSFGVDAHIALEFHEAREANPQKFNSRLRNKMFYGQAGGKDLLQRKWKDLCEMCTLECDGKDLTPLLKEHRVHAVVFLNIPSYGSGTHPWNRSFGSEQRTDDGKIEVLGLTTYQMPLLQAGGHGTCLTQCTTARIVTKKTIPMQVDGEACRVNPAIIEISHLNKAPMVTKMKAKTSSNIRTLEKVHIRVAQLGMRDYTLHHYDKEKLRLAGNFLFELDMDQDSDLEHVRREINKKICEIGCETLSGNWGFLDSCTAERFFRIDHSQEHLHYVTDICTDELFLLNPEEENSVVPEPAVVATEAPQPSGEAVRREPDASVAVPSVVRTDVSFDNDLDQAGYLSPTSECADKPGEERYCNLLCTGKDPCSMFSDCICMNQLLERHTESLIKAAKLGDLKMVKEIHNAGYSLLSIDPVGQTALHYAARLGHKDIVRYLIASAPPSILDIVDTEKGQTALHQAAANCRRSVCCMLVAAGSSLNIENHHGETARELARKAEDQELARYLETQQSFTNSAFDGQSYGN